MTVLEILRNAMGRPEPLPEYLAELEMRNAPEVAVVEALAPLESDTLSDGAFEEVRAYAEAGNPEAQRRIGLIYYRGLGVMRDHAEAFMWFSLAAENGDPVAQRSGLLILQGVSVEAAAEGRRRLAEFKGLPEPRHLTWIPEERLVRRPDGVLPSDQAAGDPNGQSPAATGMAGDRGIFIEPISASAGASAPIPLAEKRLWIAAAVGMVVLMCGAMGVMLLSDRSRLKTATFVTTDGSAGSPSFLHPNKGSRFDIQLPPPPEYLNLDDIKLDADKGKPRAQFLLGLAYARGDGVPQDLQLASLWYQKAGAQGDANAQNNLGVFYVQGTGMELNPVAAYACFSLAARGGVKGATLNRDQLAQMLSAPQLVEAVRLANRTAAAIEASR